MADQRTPEWFASRLGKVTASRIADVMAKTKTGYGAGRANYHAQLVAERLTGSVAESYSNAAMQWGTDTEPQARAMYEFETGVEVTETGFIDHPTIADSGASPDGLAGDDGLVEIKCPNTATHIDTLLSGEVADCYVKQMQFQMACSGRAWCDFASFDPRMPGDLQLWVKRVPRDDALIAEIEDAVRFFIMEMEARIRKLEALRVAA